MLVRGGLRAAYGNVRKPEGDVVGSTTRLEQRRLPRGIAVEGNVDGFPGVRSGAAAAGDRSATVAG